MVKETFPIPWFVNCSSTAAWDVVQDNAIIHTIAKDRLYCVHQIGGQHGIGHGTSLNRIVFIQELSEEVRRMTVFLRLLHYFFKREQIKYMELISNIQGPQQILLLSLIFHGRPTIFPLLV
ncbi:MAG: hypothetical protein ACI8PB_003997 [Desulforhopalus sp.]|jgi:hypothetical protein